MSNKQPEWEKNYNKCAPNATAARLSSLKHTLPLLPHRHKQQKKNTTCMPNSNGRS